MLCTGLRLLLGLSAEGAHRFTVASFGLGARSRCSLVYGFSFHFNAGSRFWSMDFFVVLTGEQKPLQFGRRVRFLELYGFAESCDAFWLTD